MTLPRDRLMVTVREVCSKFVDGKALGLKPEKEGNLFCAAGDRELEVGETTVSCEGCATCCGAGFRKEILP